MHRTVFRNHQGAFRFWMLLKMKELYFSGIRFRRQAFWSAADINSSYVIYNLLNKQKENGVAVIFVGEDLDVLLALSDRIMVLCGGKVSGIVDGRSAQKPEVGMMMTRLGGKTNG